MRPPMRVAATASRKPRGELVASMVSAQPPFDQSTISATLSPTRSTPESVGHRATVRQGIAGEDLAGAGDFERLRDEEADRSAAEERYTFEHRGLGETHGVDRHAERFEHDGVERGERPG